MVSPWSGQNGPGVTISKGKLTGKTEGANEARFWLEQTEAEVKEVS
jgi:hypothetical protein